MSVVVTIICAVLGTALAFPQFLRIVRSGSAAGVSLISWQLWAMVGAAWGVHGCLTLGVAMIIPNFASAVLSTIIIYMVCRQRRHNFSKVIMFPISLVAVALTVRLVFGPVAFGFLMLLPQACAVLGQTVNLVRSNSLYGVSGNYLRLMVLMQWMWLWYGFALSDVACTISSVMMICLVTLNLVLYVLRRTGKLAAHPGFAGRLAI